jgi:hypothetical protein
MLLVGQSLTKNYLQVEYDLFTSRPDPKQQI